MKLKSYIVKGRVEEAPFSTSKLWSTLVILPSSNANFKTKAKEKTILNPSPAFIGFLEFTLSPALAMYGLDLLVSEVEREEED